jgi:AcrR family transcriptional regulator
MLPAQPLVAQTSSDRQDLILNAAWVAFARYGFRRTSMADIAKGAGISRAALYLHYRNKEDIFRSLAKQYFETALAAMTTALAEPGKAPDAQLAAAFAAKDGALMELVLNSPHGGELMDAGFSISADITAQGEEQMAAVLAEWFAKRGVPVDLGSPVELSQTVMAALKGLKASSANYDSYRAGQVRLARLIGRALVADQRPT